MVTVPALTPVTTPEPSILAIPVLLLFQTPPEVVLESVLLEPAQTVSGPVIGATIRLGFTVTSIGALVPLTHPVGLLLSTVYDPLVVTI